MTSFAAIDVGTANHWTSSVCQVGVAVFGEGAAVEVFHKLVDPAPDQPFDPINVRLGKSDREQVRDAPTFGEVLPRLREYTSGRVAVTFSPFSRAALNNAAGAACQEPLEARWVDVMRLVHRQMPGLKCGYGLADVAAELRVPPFSPHQALEEAVATGLVLLEVCRRARHSLDEVLGEVSRGAASSREPPGDGPLAGETVVFTGGARHGPRGCDVYRRGSGRRDR